jgi:DNA-directed RNA polymerase subunit RPC12/RpoP
MKEFTFNCPTCGQPILAKRDWVGRQMKCPSCDTRITITVPAKGSSKKTRIRGVSRGGSKPRRAAKRLPGFP